MSGEQTPFRIAVRAEGNMVNAYLAPVGSMEGAQLFGSICRGACEADRQVFEEWLALMQRVLTTACKNALGVEPSRFERDVAPEHERSGHG